MPTLITSVLYRVFKHIKPYKKGDQNQIVEKGEAEIGNMHTTQTALLF